MAWLVAFVREYEVPLLILFVLLAIGLGLLLWIRMRRLNAEHAAPPPGVPVTGEVPPAAAAEPTLLTPQVMRRAFRNGLLVYRNAVAGSRNPYLVPWFLVVSPRGGGATSLCAAAGSAYPPALTPDLATGRALGCTWWFHDRAVLIDVAGEAFSEFRGGRTPDAAWGALLDETVRARNAQPVDGIILAIPVPDLAGPEALSPAALTEKAGEVYTKLWQAQKVTGLCLPVWVVLTMGDAVPGFTALQASLPDARRSDALGWSSPYAVDSSFNTAWVDEAVEAMQDATLTASLELVASGRARDAADLLRLPGELERVRGPLASLLSIVFRQTVFHETLLFRGIWLTGAAQGTAPQPQPQMQALASTAPIPLAFAQSLLVEKIFPERNLPRPVARWSIAHSRRRFYWRIATAATAALAIGLLWHGANTITGLRAEVEPPLRALAGPVALSKEREKGTLSTADIGETGASQAIRILGRLQDGYQLPLYPIAAIDNLKDRIKTALAIGHWRLLMNDIRSQLVARGDALASGRLDTATRIYPTGTSSAELQNIRRFVGEVILLDRFVGTFNRLGRIGDTAGLRELLLYTHGSELPERYTDAAAAFGFSEIPSARSLRGASLGPGAVPLDTVVIRQALTDRFKTLALAYFDQLARAADALAPLRDAAKAIDLLVQNPAAPGAGETLDQLSRNLSASDGALQKQDGPPVTSEGEIGGAAFQALMQVTADTPLLGPSVRDQVLAVGRERLAPLADSVTEINSAIGPLLSPAAERNRLELSPPAAQLKTSLAALQLRPFMRPAEVVPVVQPGTMLFRWDVRGLEQIVSLVENYTVFVAQDYPKLPVPLRPAVRAVTQQRLAASVSAGVTAAQRQVPAQLREDDLRQIVDETRSAQPVLLRLIRALRQTGAAGPARQVVNLAVGQSLAMLDRLGAVLAADPGYQPDVISAAVWNGDKVDTAALYNVNDPSAVAAALEQVRVRIQGLSRTIAAPLLAFLAEPELQPVRQGGGWTTWSRIASELERAAGNRPGSSVIGLERFVTAQLPEISTDSCEQITARGGGVGDWFTEQQIRLRARLEAACAAARADRGVLALRTIAVAFTQYLAGKYPFAPIEKAETGPYASSDDVAAFFEVYDANIPAAQAAAAKLETVGMHLVPFLTALRETRAFFAPLVGLDSGGQGGATLEAHFHTLLERDKGGEDIIEWKLATRDAALSNAAAQPPSLVWTLGTPLGVSLRWARNGPVRPLSLEAERARLNDLTISVQYDDPWSLVTLIRRHRPSTLDWRSGPGRLPHILAFNVATGPMDGSPGPATQAHVFIELIVKSGTAQGATRLALPDTLPLAAPSLLPPAPAGAVALPPRKPPTPAPAAKVPAPAPAPAAAKPAAPAAAPAPAPAAAKPAAAPESKTPDISKLPFKLPGF